FAAPSEATAYFASDVGPFFDRCAKRLVGTSRPTGKLLSVRRLDLGLGANGIAFRSVVELGGSAGRERGYGDGIFLRDGRSVSGLLLTSTGSPFEAALERRLV